MQAPDTASTMPDAIAENASALTGIVTELGLLRLALAAAGTGKASGLRPVEATTLYTRALSLGALLAPHLAGSKLPLPRDLHQLAGECMQALGELAVPHGATGLAAASRRPAQSLNLLREQLVISYLSGAGAPSGLWVTAHALYACARGRPGQEAGAAASAYKSLLALATARPESLTGQEILWTARHLGEYAGLASLRDTPPPADEAGWFWFNPAADQPPAALSLKKPPDGETLSYFSPAPMASAMTAGTAAQEGATALTESADQRTPPAILSLLRRLRERWTLPARREQPRRSNRYAVQVCTGLDAIWAMLREPDPQVQAGLTTEWMVLNESASGYAIMHLAGTAGNLAAGMVLALRRPAERMWTLCLARWLRTDSPNRVELGLQVLSQDAQPVSIGFSARPGGQMRNALLLPPVAALRRHAAILAPAGSYTGRHFVLVVEDGRLYVAQGQLLGLDIQTESIELFQYEIDQYAH
ncbi:MAG: hypothetical protein HGA47_05955 [Zoogloea sp.]|nr:hypothetical protein [Zoogloea sp.]